MKIGTSNRRGHPGGPVTPLSGLRCPVAAAHRIKRRPVASATLRRGAPRSRRPKAPGHEHDGLKPPNGEASRSARSAMGASAGHGATGHVSSAPRQSPCSTVTAPCCGGPARRRICWGSRLTRSAVTRSGSCSPTTPTVCVPPPRVRPGFPRRAEHCSGTGPAGRWMSPSGQCGWRTAPMSWPWRPPPSASRNGNTASRSSARSSPRNGRDRPPRHGSGRGANQHHPGALRRTAAASRQPADVMSVEDAEAAEAALREVLETGSPTPSATPAAPSGCGSSARTSWSARSPTPAAPSPACAGRAGPTRAAAVCTWSPRSPPAGAVATAHTARPSGPNSPWPSRPAPSLPWVMLS